MSPQVDPGHPSSTSYWLSVLDTDEDGVLSLGELRPFYLSSLRLLASCGLAVVPVAWEDLVTQLLDTSGRQAGLALPSYLPPQAWTRWLEQGTARWKCEMASYCQCFHQHIPVCP